MSSAPGMAAESTLELEELRLLDACWRAANYLSVGQIEERALLIGGNLLAIVKQSASPATGAGARYVGGSCRPATTRPARQPGARPPGGGCAESTSRPLRAIRHEINEFEFHISPAPTSSRPQTGVGT